MFRQFVASIRNLFSHGRDRDTDNIQGGQLEGYSLAGGSVPGYSRGTKRAFEPEITDDEDDCQTHLPTVFVPVNKKFRADRIDPSYYVGQPGYYSQPNDPIMNNPTGYHNMTTRQKGPPGVPGRVRQPWEFDFSYLNKNRLENRENNDVQIIGEVRGQPGSNVSSGHSRRSVGTLAPFQERQVDRRDRESRPNAPVPRVYGTPIPTAFQSRNRPTDGPRLPAKPMSLLSNYFPSKLAGHKNRIGSWAKAVGIKPKIQKKDYWGSNEESLVDLAIREKKEKAEALRYRQMLLSFTGFGSGENSKLKLLGRRFTVPVTRVSKEKTDELESSWNTSGGTLMVQNILPMKIGLPSTSFTRSFNTSPQVLSTPTSTNNASGISDFVDLTKEDDLVAYQARSSYIESSTIALCNLVKLRCRSLKDAEKKIACGQGLDTSTISVDTELVSVPESEGRVSDDVTILAERIYPPDLSAIMELKQKHLEQEEKTKNSMAEYRERQEERAKELAKLELTLKIIKEEVVRPSEDVDIAEMIRDQLRFDGYNIPVPILHEPLPEITDEMEEIIRRSLDGANDREKLSERFRIDILRGDVKTLKPPNWLNDSVINMYLEMINERSQNDPTLPKVHCFSTFFYQKLAKEGNSTSLKRWTRKIDLFAFDLLIFPIHMGMHWTLAVADFREKNVSYYDSLLGTNCECLDAIMKFIDSEHLGRKGTEIKEWEWDQVHPTGVPQQGNGSDCGMFLCKIAEALSRGEKLEFHYVKAKNMNYYRRRMVYEVVTHILMKP